MYLIWRGESDDQPLADTEVILPDRHAKAQNNTIIVAFSLTNFKGNEKVQTLGQY